MTAEEKHGLLYIRIAGEIKSEIMEGTLSSGEQLPGVRELAARFETSGKTISRALDELESSGFIERTQGKGIFVRTADTKPGTEEAVLGCLCPSTGSFAADVLVSALEEQAGIEGRELLIRRFDPEHCNCDELIISMMEKNARGVFLISAGATRFDIPNPEVPLIRLGNPETERGPGHSITWDLAGGIEACMDHLVGNGHSEIGFLGTGRELNADPGYYFFRKDLERRGLKFDPDRCECCSIRGADGFDSMKLLLDRTRDFTAIICMHDNLAAGAVKAAFDSGLEVPADLCVTGWGGTELSAAAVPSITTLDWDPLSTAVSALGCMEQLSAGKLSTSFIRLQVPMELVIRDSSVNREINNDDRWV